ncbi:MAG TPA: tetratricopeptide repeat protein [Candidatus Paceibacterota bacterium]
MQITKTHKIVFSILAVVILLAVYIMFDKKSRDDDQSPSDDTSQNLASTTNTTTGVGMTTQGTGSYKIEQVSATDVPRPIPDLDRPVTPYGAVMVSTEAKVQATEMILKTQSILKKDPSYTAGWMNLGIYQKMSGDYEGAVISWIYITKLSPNSYLAYANLGNLYAYFIKNNTKAEAYYKQAISKDPTRAYLYGQLAEAYRDVFKDLDKARAIVDQGLLKVPNDQNLLQLKESLKTS